MKSNADRSHAEDLFVREGRTLEETAALVGTSKATLARWSKEGGWLDQRHHRRAAPSRAIDVVRARLAAMIEKMSANPDDDEKLEDRLTKLMAVLDKLEAGLGIDTVLSIMEQFAAFAAGRPDAGDMADGTTRITIIRSAVEQFLDAKRKELS